MFTTPADAITALIASRETMSTEARKAQARNRRTYGAKFDAASRQHLAASYWLQANARGAWDFITADNTVSTDAARKLLDSVAVAA